MGRAALLAKLDQLLIEQPADRWLVVTGGPGMGKSALLAQWLARREAAGNPVPHHFIRRGEYDWDDPARLAASLVAQVAALFPAHIEPEADACGIHSIAITETGPSRSPKPIDGDHRNRSIPIGGPANRGDPAELIRGCGQA